MVLFQGLLGVLFFLALFGAFFWVVISAKAPARVVTVLLATAIASFIGHEWGRNVAERGATELYLVERQDLGQVHRKTLAAMATKNGNSELEQWMDEARNDGMDIDTLVYFLQEKMAATNE